MDYLTPKCLCGCPHPCSFLSNSSISSVVIGLPSSRQTAYVNVRTRALFFLSKFSLVRRELLHAKVLCRCPYALIFFRNLLLSRELLHAYVLCRCPHARSFSFELFSLVSREILHAKVLCGCPHSRSFFFQLSSLVSRELLHAKVLCGYPHALVFFLFSSAVSPLSLKLRCSESDASSSLALI